MGKHIKFHFTYTAKLWLRHHKVSGKKQDIREENWDTFAHLVSIYNMNCCEFGSVLYRTFSKVIPIPWNEDKMFLSLFKVWSIYLIYCIYLGSQANQNKTCISTINSNRLNFSFIANSNVSEPQTGIEPATFWSPISRLLYLLISEYRDSCIRSTCVAHTNRCTSWPSLCHLSPGTVAQWLERLTGDQKVASSIPWTNNSLFGKSLFNLFRENWII